MFRNTLIFMVIVISISFISCTKQKTAGQTARHRVAVMNPNLGYLKSLDYLVQNKIISIDDLEMELIQYAPYAHDTEAIESFLSQPGHKYITQTFIDGKLSPQNLFQKNELSATFEAIFKRTNAILFLGGADFPPQIYNAKTSLLTRIVTPQRHYSEISFLFHLLGGSQDTSFTPLLASNPDFIIRAFCLGMQSLNAATGGDMYQDIPSELYDCRYAEDVLQLPLNQQHRNYWSNLFPGTDINNHNFHQIAPLPGSFFETFQLLEPGVNPTVCSSHHQAVHKIGYGLRIAAKSMDGKVVEALQHKRFQNVIGTQFHPEFSTLYDPRAPKLKRTPTDTLRLSEHDILLKTKSLEFHLRFWKQFSEVVNKAPLI